ncbi:MAG: hypothetical protein M3323_14355 [Actinomycetota bacterium]|nr:hypothetical protein [Actinomycetota bacterium]
MNKKLFASVVGIALTCAPLVHPSAASAATPSFVRGVYGRDASPSGTATLKSTGFNTVTVQPWRDHLDGLQAQGLGGLVWLFGYDNATCSFDRDDAWIRETVTAIRGHEAIVAYNVADEPNYRQCPDSPAEIAARARLVKSLDPSKPTYVVVAAWDGREGFPYQHFAGTTDIMGLDIYPCAYSLTSCKYSDIGAAAEEAVKDGVDRYWAILQDFADNWYRVPSAEELERQFDHWGRTGMEGYFVYHWNEGQVETRPDHLAVLREQNARTFGAAAPSPTASPTPSPTPTPGATTDPAPTVPPADTTPVPDPEPVIGTSPLPAPRPGTARPDVRSPFGGRPQRADRRAPTAPRGLLSALLDRGSYLWWEEARDDRAVKGYVVRRDGKRIGRTRSTEFLDPKRLNGRHVYTVRAFDGAGNRSKPAVLKVTSWRRDVRTSWTCVHSSRVYRSC